MHRGSSGAPAPPALLEVLSSSKRSEASKEPLAVLLSRTAERSEAPKVADGANLYCVTRLTDSTHLGRRGLSVQANVNVSSWAAEEPTRTIQQRIVLRRILNRIQNTVFEKVA